MAYWDGSKEYEGNISVIVNDIEKSVLYDTLNISNSVANRSECSFEIYVDSKNEIVQGNHVDIILGMNVDNDFIMFAGRIVSINVAPIVQGGTLLKASIKCVDYNHVLDRILVAEEYIDKTIYYIVNDIYEKYLINEWVAIYTYPGVDVTIEKAVFSYITISECFRYLCDETAYNYIVQNDGWIDFFYKEDMIIDNIDKSHIFDISVDMTLDNYRNRQFIKGGYDETTVTDEVLTPAPDNATTTFFSRYPLGTVPTVKISGTTVTAASVGIDGIDEDKWFYWNKGINKLSQNVELLPTLTSGNVSMSYKGLIKILIQADNVEGQTEMTENETSDSVWGTGVYSNIMEVPSIQTRNEAINYANGMLYKYQNIPECVNIKSFVYRPVGYMLQIDYTGLTNDQYYFIESVNIYSEAGRIRYDYKMLNGESLSNWTEFFRNINKRQDMLINDDVQLIKLQRQPEEFDICSEYDISIRSPLYLSGSVTISEYRILGGVAVYGKNYYPVFLSDTLYLDDAQPISIITDNTIILKD